MKHTIYAEGEARAGDSNRMRLLRVVVVVVVGDAAAGAPRVKPVHPELKNERQENERTDTARRLVNGECDNGLQSGWW